LILVPGIVGIGGNDSPERGVARDDAAVELNVVVARLLDRLRLPNIIVVELGVVAPGEAVEI
jgi:hypothetical protein